MGVGGGLYMYDVVVKKFTFAISSLDEFLSYLLNGWRYRLRIWYTDSLYQVPCTYMDDKTSPKRAWSWSCLWNI